MKLNDTFFLNMHNLKKFISFDYFQCPMFVLSFNTLLTGPVRSISPMARARRPNTPPCLPPPETTGPGRLGPSTFQLGKTRL